jgi:hypothetical protein
LQKFVYFVIVLFMLEIPSDTNTVPQSPQKQDELSTIDKFKHELVHLINRHSLENGSDTPDFIVAEFLVDCLLAVDKMIKRRDEWYGDKRWSGTGIIGQPKEGQVGNAPEK